MFSLTFQGIRGLNLVSSQRLLPCRKPAVETIPTRHPTACSGNSKKTTPHTPLMQVWGESFRPFRFVDGIIRDDCAKSQSRSRPPIHRQPPYPVMQTPGTAPFLSCRSRHRLGSSTHPHYPWGNRRHRHVPTWSFRTDSHGSSCFAFSPSLPPSPWQLRSREAPR